MILLAAVYLTLHCQPNANGVWPVSSELIKPYYLSRIVFSQKMWQIKDGMTKDEVKMLIGEPDDVVENDVSFYPRHEDWCYGTNGHGTFPTLGVVAFTNGTAFAPLADHYSDPPPEGMFDEGTLRSLIRQVDWSFCINPDVIAGTVNEEPDPLAVIRAELALFPLGKEHSLAVIREAERAYLSVRTIRHRLILLELFGISNTLEPERSSQSDQRTREEYSESILGVPLAFNSYGSLRRIRELLQFLESKGVFIKRVERPTSDLGAVIDRFMATAPAKTEHARKLLKQQVLRQLLLLVRTAIAPYPWLLDRRQDPEDDQWELAEKMLRGLKHRGLYWNAKEARYELPGQKPIDPIGYTYPIGLATNR